MGKVLATIKAIITRLVFACHGVIAIAQVEHFKADIQYWYLATPLILLLIEGIFTITIKENQEWKWFCPSVFIYLGLVVPAIWLLELRKVENRLQSHTFNKCPNETQELDLQLNADTQVTLIEQFLMLTLIVGRWLLPKGDLTRDQLSQLLLVYIGTAADIIEFFDSFKEDRVASDHVLVMLTLGIWSWSLLQFTVVLTATKSRKSRGAGHHRRSDASNRSTNCCSIEVCAIIMNIVLQDAPFLAFRMLIIFHYKIVSYMNIFFTSKNTLVILLQIYRLYVLYLERNDELVIPEPKVKKKHRRRSPHNRHLPKVHKKPHERKKTAVLAESPSDKEQPDRSKPRKKPHERKKTPALTESPSDKDQPDRFKALVLTNAELKEIDLKNLFSEKVTLTTIDETKKKQKRKRNHKRKSDTSEESANVVVHSTDDSGI